MGERLLNLQSAGPPTNNAFIMCIGNYVVVEFGLTGNACFIFRIDELPFELSGCVNGDSTGLKSQSQVDRLLHIDASEGTWEQKFQRILAKLMSVQPGQAVTSSDASVLKAPTAFPGRIETHSGMIHMPQQSNIGKARPTLQSANNAAPPSQTALFAERDLAEFCRAHQLQIEDLRDRNGNCWVLTEDSDGYVSSKLRSWGFTYKSGKGWWRK